MFIKIVWILMEVYIIKDGIFNVFIFLLTWRSFLFLKTEN